MTPDLHKRLDEAAAQYCKDYGRTGEINGYDVTAFKHGAEWKDQQFKEYLEKKQSEFLKHTREDFLGRHFDVSATLIGEIINELFGGE